MNWKNEFQILLLMGTSQGFGRLLIDGISQYAFEQGHSIDLEFRGYTEAFPPWVECWKGDGVIVRDTFPQTRQILQKLGLPYIKVHCLDCVSDVEEDLELLMDMAIEHFLFRGLKHFAYFSQCKLFWTHRRKKYFEKALKHRGKQGFYFERQESDMAPFSSWQEKERKRFLRWLHTLPKPVGLLAASDLHARLVLEVCKKHGIRVPYDVSVLGVNDEKWFCRIQSPPLSSIIMDGKKSGYEAMKILCQKIAGESVPEFPVKVPPLGVHTRSSTDVTVVDDQDVVEVLNMIRENACQGVELEEIVAAIGLSRRTLERKFKKAFGHTMNEEIIRTRLERVKELLGETELKISSIASQTGFWSHSHLIHTFQKKVGCSPIQYRNHCQGND
ncbi:MAG: XylR family transcriptional regulator [Planctomycetia bacterium]|nr:XylR family transcriptional regulator [Planctomycetia bacterium]